MLSCVPKKGFAVTAKAAMTAVYVIKSWTLCNTEQVLSCAAAKLRYLVLRALEFRWNVNVARAKTRTTDNLDWPSLLSHVHVT